MTDVVIGNIKFPATGGPVSNPYVVTSDNNVMNIETTHFPYGGTVDRVLDTKRFRIITLKTSGFNPNDYISEHWTEREAELEIEHLNYGYPLGLLVKTSDWSLTKVYVNSNWYVYKSRQILRSTE